MYITLFLIKLHTYEDNAEHEQVQNEHQYTDIFFIERSNPFHFEKHDIYTVFFKNKGWPLVWFLILLNLIELNV